jgi:hypothetical protein
MSVSLIVNELIIRKLFVNEFLVCKLLKAIVRKENVLYKVFSSLSVLVVSLKI